MAWADRPVTSSVDVCSIRKPGKRRAGADVPAVPEKWEPGTPSPARVALVFPVVVTMGFAGGQRPSGIGYTRDGPPKQSPLESPAPWSDKEDQPRRMRPRRRKFLLAILIALVIVASVIAVLAFVVVAQYPQHQSISLNAGDDWKSPVCIPVPVNGGSTNVTFDWTTSSPSMVLLQVVPWGSNESGLYPPVYDVIAAGGSGSFLSTKTSFVLDFAATGAPTLPAFVNITLSYDVPGHMIGGPTSDTSC